MKRYRIRFYGRVQGVGFRYTAYHLAQRERLVGWVENEPDGSVLCEVQGEREAIDKFLAELCDGRYIRVDDMRIEERELEEYERSFSIRG